MNHTFLTSEPTDKKDLTSENKIVKSITIKWPLLLIMMIATAYTSHFFSSQHVSDELGLSRLKQLTQESKTLSGEVGLAHIEWSKQTALVHQKQKELDEEIKKNKEKSEVYYQKLTAYSGLQQQIQKINTAIFYMKKATNPTDSSSGFTSPATGTTLSGQ